MIAAFAFFVVLLDGMINVPKRHWQGIEIPIEKPGSVVEISFKSPSSINALLLTREQAGRFDKAAPLASSGFKKSAEFRAELDRAGEYVLLLDNRAEILRDTPVSLKVTVHPPRQFVVQMASPERRLAVILLSVIFVMAVVGFSARQFLK